MKTSRNIISFVIAAGAPGVALLALANVIAADAALALLSVGALVAFAAFDYSRNTASLRARARILRPALPGATLAATACQLDRAA
jgi:hypothetical protein